MARLLNPIFQNVDNFTPIQSLDAGFPAYTPPSNAQDRGLNTFTKNTVTYVAHDYGRPGMVQNWQLEVQRELATDLIFAIGYVGQHGTRLRSNLAQVNSPDPKYNALGAKLDDLVDSPAGQATLAQLGVTVPSWFVPGWGSEAKVGQLLRPFPQYDFITSNCCLENLGQSTYHALETKLERRFRNGLNLLASYTYSKTITDADSSFSTLTGFTSNILEPRIRTTFALKRLSAIKTFRMLSCSAISTNYRSDPARSISTTVSPVKLQVAGRSAVSIAIKPDHQRS